MSATNSRSPWWWAAVGFAGLMAVVGLAKPSVALPIAVICAVGLALLALVYSIVVLFARVRSAPRSPFAPALYERPPQLLPQHIARIVPDAADKKPALTPGARAAVATVATERLWARHALNLHDYAHQPAIEQLVSSDLWGVIRPDRAAADGRYLPRAPMLHADLDRLLDDLDRI